MGSRWIAILQAKWEFMMMTFKKGTRGHFRLNLLPTKFFLLNFTKIIWFFWDLRLTLYDIPKDVGLWLVLGEILAFSNIFGFLAVNWALKWTKTINFGCFPFEPKFKTLTVFSNTVFVLLGTTSDYFSKIEQYLGEYSPKKPPKRDNFMDTASI